MGIYIVKSKYCNWFKIGHHKITESRPNIYFRYINRGFYSCISPIELNNKLSYDDIELLYWFINLDTKDELNIHNDIKIKYNKCGEWFFNIDINYVVNLIKTKYKGIDKYPTIEDLNIAKKKFNIK